MFPYISLIVLGCGQSGADIGRQTFSSDVGRCESADSLVTVPTLLCQLWQNGRSNFSVFGDEFCVKIFVVEKKKIPCE
jgi:hypothetical protein